MSFKFAFKCTVIITGSNTRRKTVPNFWGCYRKTIALLPTVSVPKEVGNASERYPDEDAADVDGDTFHLVSAYHSHLQSTKEHGLLSIDNRHATRRPNTPYTE